MNSNIYLVDKIMNGLQNKMERTNVTFRGKSVGGQSIKKPPVKKEKK